MKKIGLIFALKEELEATIKEIKLEEEIKVFDLTIYKCIYNDVECFLVESGIGKVNAARCTQILIDKENVECIINVGVAGSISKDIKIGDIVVGEKMVQHDFDLTSFGREKGEIPNVDRFIKCNESLIKISKKINYLPEKIHYGTIASGDIFISEKAMSEKIFKKFNALCVEMEGAAIAQVCFLCDIPFIVIRAISDSPNAENNYKTYEEFLNSSSEEVASFIIQFMNNLK